MLAFLVALLAAGGPLALGAVGLGAQTVFFLLAVAGGAAWLVWRVFVGYLPMPAGRVMAWTAALAALLALSALLSRAPDAAALGWRAQALGLWLFLAVSCVSKDGRAGVDEALRWCGWTMVLLAAYQRFFEGQARPAAAFAGENLFAGFALMLLPLAAQRGDRLLAAGLVLCLWWTKSAGAWLGLAAALALSRGGLSRRAGLGLGLVCAVVLYAGLESPETLERWRLWGAAWRMSWDAPLLGLGPGTFGAALPAYTGSARPAALAHAHQHFLQTAAECGWPYLILWAGGLAWLLRGASHKRFAAVAVLVQSLWDPVLAIPGNFWLFCYCAASSLPHTSLGLGIPSRRKAAAALLVILAASASGWHAWRRWQSEPPPYLGASQ